MLPSKGEKDSAVKFGKYVILYIPSELQHKWTPEVLINAAGRKEIAGIYLTWP